MRAHVSGSKELIKQLEKLGAAAEQAAASAVRDTAFEVAKDLGRQVASTLNLGDSGKQFVERGWRVRYGRAGNIFKATIAPLAKTAAFLIKHQEGATLTAQNSQENLEIDGKLALPIAVKRSGRGRVRSDQTPQAIVERGGFVLPSGKAIMRRTARKVLEVAYVLVDKASFRRRFDVHDIAAQSAARHFDAKLRSAITRQWGRILGRSRR